MKIILIVGLAIICVKVVKEMKRRKAFYRINSQGKKEFNLKQYQMFNKKSI